jgi:hypothetical protein
MKKKKSHKNSVRCSTDACGTPIWFTAPLAWVPHMSFEEKHSDKCNEQIITIFLISRTLLPKD